MATPQTVAMHRGCMIKIYTPPTSTGETGRHTRDSRAGPVSYVGTYYVALDKNKKRNTNLLKEYQLHFWTLV